MRKTLFYQVKENLKGIANDIKSFNVLLSEVNELGEEKRGIKPMIADKDDVRIITNKYPAKCAACNQDVGLNENVYYHIKIKKCIHKGCINSPS